MCACELFLREVLVDHLLPAVGAASCSSQQWEKRAGEARLGGPGGLQQEAAKAVSCGGSQTATEEVC